MLAKSPKIPEISIGKAGVESRREPIFSKLQASLDFTRVEFASREDSFLFEDKSTLCLTVVKT